MNITTLYQAGTQTPPWRVVTDQVMGGVSKAQLFHDTEGTHLVGDVSLENNGGFIQIQLDRPKELSPELYQGVFIEWRSEHAQPFELLIKSSQLWMPWQSYRAKAMASQEWQSLFIPFQQFTPYKTQTQLRLDKITKFSVLAGGEDKFVQLSIRQFGLYN